MKKKELQFLVILIIFYLQKSLISIQMLNIIFNNNFSYLLDAIKVKKTDLPVLPPEQEVLPSFDDEPEDSRLQNSK